MDDGQVPPEAGEEKSGPTRPPALRLSDAPDVAATRLDMFGDYSLRDSLARPSAGAGDGAGPEPPLPADAAADGTGPQTFDQPPTHAPEPTALPPPGGEPRIAAGLDYLDAGQRPPEASEHVPSDVAAEPQTGPPAAEQPSRTEPAAAAAPETGVGAAAVPGAADAAEDAPRGAKPEWWNGAAGAAGPFGSAFMMPPGLTEHEADMSTGPINERPRFRDELIKPIPTPIVSDAAAPEAELSPAAELPHDPPFTESPAPIPEERVAEDSPGVTTFSGLSGVSPYPEEGPAYGEPSPLPMPAEPAPPPSSPLFDAAAKIAAEANATAEALENLKRLLGHTIPRLEPVETAYRPDRTSERIAPADPLADGLRLRMRGMQGMQPEQPPPFTALHEPAPLLPLPVPPPRASSRGVYLLGFLTGLALSLMAGGVLYFFIAHISPG
jgi:hypothetical protein